MSFCKNVLCSSQSQVGLIVIGAGSSLLLGGVSSFMLYGGQEISRQLGRYCSVESIAKLPANITCLGVKESLESNNSTALVCTIAAVILGTVTLVGWLTCYHVKKLNQNQPRLADL